MEHTKTSTEIIKANFSIELSKIKYQDALQSITSYEITKDNLIEAHDKIRQAKKILSKFDEIKTNGKAAALAECKMWDEAYNSLKSPFENVIIQKTATISKLALEIEADKKKAEQEKERVSGIKQAIDSFFIAQSQAIAGAKTLGELTAIEKIIGSHKANKARYAEFLPDLVGKAENLTPLIKQQKDNIRKLEAVKEAEAKATESGDDQAVLDAREAQESLQNKFDEVNIKAQEQAVGMATRVETVVVPEVVLPAAPRPRRQVWVYESTDINETLKKMPNFVELSLNKEKVDEYLKAKKAEGIDGDEFTVFGIRFFIQKSF